METQGLLDLDFGDAELKVLANTTFINLYIDGACSGNPGRGGWAVIEKKDDKYSKVISGSKKETTNNEMELTALHHALNYIEGLTGSNKVIVVNIYCDSTYVVNGITEWVHNWIQNGSINDRPNSKLWWECVKLYNELIKTVSIMVIKVKGHSGNVGNQLADKEAVIACNIIK